MMKYLELIDKWVEEWLEDFLDWNAGADCPKNAEFLSRRYTHRFQIVGKSIYSSIFDQTSIMECCGSRMEYCNKVFRIKCHRCGLEKDEKDDELYVRCSQCGYVDRVEQYSY